MRKIENIMTEIWKLSTNVWKTNHVISKFEEEWRNVVECFMCCVWKYRHYFVAGNMWVKRTRHNIFCSFHRIRIYFFSQNSGKMCMQTFFCLHAVYKILKRYRTKCCEWTKYFPLKEKFCPGYGKISPPTERLLMLSISVSRREVVFNLDVFYYG